MESSKRVPTPPARHRDGAPKPSRPPFGDETTSAGRWISARRLRLLLGAIWLVDAALQFQPYMFSRAFVHNVLEASAQGAPGFVAVPTLLMAHFLAPHIAEWNAFFASIQLALALGILGGEVFGRTRLLKAALAASFAWAGVVWWLSEGLGGVFSGASPFVGAPGAVTLYALAGILLWPRGSARSQGMSAPLAAGRLARVSWLALWAGCAWLALEPANRSRGAVSSLVLNAANGEPGPLHALLFGAATSVRGSGLALDLVASGLMLLIGIAVFLRLYTRLFLVLAMALALAIWTFGEAWGGILTGQGTDPNSGPLLVLVALCMWLGATEGGSLPSASVCLSAPSTGATEAA